MRIRALLRVLVPVAVFLQCTLAGGQEYPTKPVRIIVPFAAAGGTDILARSLGSRLSETMGQQFIVDNRGGAGGLIGNQIGATSAPDGYTLVLGSMGGLAHNPALRPDLPYNPLRDFTAVTLLATSPFLLVAHPAVPAKSVKELVDLARAKPGTLNYGSSGAGSSLHLTSEYFKYVAKVNITHVAYKGTGPALAGLLGGEVQMVFSTPAPALPQVKAGKLRALGVSTLKRVKGAPDIPTIAESGVPGFEVANWQGIVAPAKTPPAIIERLNRELTAILKSPSMVDMLAAQGLDPAPSTPAEFEKLIKSEIVKWTKVVKAAGIKIE